MKKLFNFKTLLITFLFLPSIACAELVIINGNSWDYGISGKIRDSGSIINEIDLDTDLFLQDNKEAFFVAYIEHPIPVLPNIRLGSTALNITGSGTTTGSVTYNNVPINFALSTSTRLNLDHTEIGLYWNILDNVVGLDLGLNVKFFDGSVYITDGTNTARETFDETIPMLYAGLQIELPYGFQIAGDLSYLSYDGSSFTDSLIRLRYTSDFNLGAEIGYRRFVLDYQDTTKNEYVNINISGPYIGVHLAF